LVIYSEIKKLPASKPEALLLKNQEFKFKIKEILHLVYQNLEKIANIFFNIA
jgi:hypothetical protein